MTHPEGFSQRSVTSTGARRSMLLRPLKNHPAPFLGLHAFCPRNWNWWQDTDSERSKASFASLWTMARCPRVVVPGVARHTTQRGARRLQVFISEEDHGLCPRILSRQASWNGLDGWSCCLMHNHVHLIAMPATKEAPARSLGEAHPEAPQGRAKAPSLPDQAQAVHARAMATMSSTAVSRS